MQHYFMPPSADKKKFQNFVLESIEPVSSTSTIFTLLPSTPLGKPGQIGPATGHFFQGVWSVEVKQPQLQIARAYTPLPPLQGRKGGRNDSALRFLIRHDPKGEVSSYIHKLPLGSRVELRGPQIEYQLPMDVDEVVFIAGGTGIAPALQVAHALYETKHDDQFDPHGPRRHPPRLRILWANRKEEDCVGGPSVPPRPISAFRSFFTSGSSPRSDTASKNPNPSPLVRHLQHLEVAHPEHFSVDYFVDEDWTFINEQAVKDSLQITQRKGSELASRKKLILVSGPEGFVNYVAGPKRWLGGREVQGELGGLLSRIDHSGWEVWKL
ncbi:mitochondrial peripheral inner membrane protein [Trapelia coarctata]|nr:mitochondrial peripheral inner membrane protein [Trapelia coarctata]